MKEDIFWYVHQCDLCQREKPAQNTKVGLHQATPASYPLVFIDFMGPLVRTKKGNQAILVVVYSFSKFVAFYPVRQITSAIVCEILESRYFTAYGMPKLTVSDNTKVFKSKAFFFIFAFNGESKKVTQLHTTPRVLLQRELTET